MNYQNFLAQHNIDFKEVSSGWLQFKCINPLHDDSTPSMGLRLEDGFVNCFGCGWKGSFKSFCSNLLGEGTPDQYAFTAPIRKPVLKVIDYPEIEVFGEFENVYDHIQAWEFLNSIGVYNFDFIEEYGVRFAPKDKIVKAIARNLVGTEKEVNATIYKNRIIFPIKREGKLINIEGRSILPKDVIASIDGYRKVIYTLGGSSHYLWGYDQVDLSKDVVVCEGVKGASKVWNVHRNVVALFHALPTYNQIELLKRVKGDIIVFANADKAGLGTFTEDGRLKLKGTIQALEKLGKDFKLCYDERKHPDRKEFDENDCSEDEIKRHIDNACWYSVYKENGNKKPVLRKIKKEAQRIIKNKEYDLLTVKIPKSKKV